MRVPIKHLRLILFLLISLGTLVTSISLLQSHKSGKRAPASAEVLERSAQIKIQMIQSLQWSTEGEQLHLQIFNGLEDICESWKDMTVFVQADGIAVSGTPPTMRFHSTCEDQRFQLRLSRDISTWGEGHQTFIDLGAEQFFVAALQIKGPLGIMTIHANEIYTHLNQILEFNKK